MNICSVATTVSINGIKTLLANGLSTFFIKREPVFCSGPKNLPKNPFQCNWVFNNFISADEVISKVSQSLETCQLVNNNSRGKLISSLE